jgi:hypothetical protein
MDRMSHSRASVFTKHIDAESGQSMNQFPKDGLSNSVSFGEEPTNNHSLSVAGLMTTAERELSAFFNAVTELIGSEQARVSAEDWLQEFETLDSLSQLTRRDWREVTVAASVRLASRLHASSQSSESQHLQI